MPSPHIVVWMCSIGLISMTATVSGQNYPNKPIRIVTNAVGGGSDFMSRLIAQGISGPLGQPVIVQNRPSGLIPAVTVATALPDGYTLLFVGTPLWIAPLLQSKVPYDAIKDFAPISYTNVQPNILVVPLSLPVKSVNELIAMARAKPGELNYAGGATGSSVHLAAELLNTMAKIKTVRIPYQSGAVALIDLIAGNVKFSFATTSVATHINAGRLRALAITSAQPSSIFPGVPTVASSLPGYELDTIDGLLAPAKTPAAVIRRLNQEVVQFLATAEAKARIVATGSETVGSSPEQFSAKIKSEISKMGKVIQEAGIRAE